MEDADQRVIAKSELLAALSRLGVLPGQVVMLHASVKAIGWIVGGPDMVLEAILDLLTPGGTLTMMVSWDAHPYYLKECSEDTQQLYLAECPPFDPATSRADHRELGILTEYLRTRQGAVRSTHPLFSFVAIGAKANWLVENHPLQYGVGPGSPLAKLCEAGGKVLSLGAPLNTLTLLHYAEHLANVAPKRVARYKMPVVRDAQREWIELEEYDTDDMIDWEGEDYFELIVRDYLKAGKGSTGKVGDAPAYLIDAVDITQFGINWMETTFRGELKQLKVGHNSPPAPE